MNEKFPNPENTLEKKVTKEDCVQLATELVKRPESFPFKGLEDEAYAKIKATDEEYPGFTTPIDELIKKFADHGIKVSFGDDPKSGNIFLVPSNSSDVGNDGLSPKNFKATEDMDPELKKLIESAKQLAASMKK